MPALIFLGRDDASMQCSQHLRIGLGLLQVATIDFQHRQLGGESREKTLILAAVRLKVELGTHAEKAVKEVAIIESQQQYSIQQQRLGGEFLQVSEREVDDTPQAIDRQERLPCVVVDTPGLGRIASADLALAVSWRAYKQRCTSGIQQRSQAREHKSTDLVEMLQACKLYT